MRRSLIGVVTSDRNSKTRRVDVERLFQHPKYKKIVRGRTVCYVHDEGNESKIGDTVEIVECRPRSKTKRWELVRVVTSIDVVASRLQREEQQEEREESPSAESTIAESVTSGADSENESSE